MTTTIRARFGTAKEDLKRKRKPSGWVLEKQKVTFADPDRWTNIDTDVTPVHRRTWTTFTVLGFWISDAMNAQGWECKFERSLLSFRVKEERDFHQGRDASS